MQLCANDIVQIVDAVPRKSSPRAVNASPRSLSTFALPTSSYCPLRLSPTTLPEFADGLARVSVHSIHHHFIEARLRLKLILERLLAWMQEELEMKEAARRLNRIDIYTATLEDVRRQIIRIVESALRQRNGQEILWKLSGSKLAEIPESLTDAAPPIRSSGSAHCESVATVRECSDTPPAPPPPPRLDDYEAIVGKAELDELRFLAERPAAARR